MAEYADFRGPAGSVLLEIAGADGEGSGSGNLRDVTRVIQDIVAATLAEIEKLKDKKPTEFQLAFALRGLPNGQAAVVLDENQAHFRVTMRWGSSMQIPVPTAPPVPPNQT